MKTKTSQNQGINMTIEDVRAKIAQKKEQHAKQQARKEKLEQTMQNTSQDIEQLEYTLTQLERAQLERAESSPARRKPRFIPRHRIASFIHHASRVFDRLQRRLRRTLNYTWFCLVLCSRYVMESRCQNPQRRYLTPATVLGYFKREREE